MSQAALQTVPFGSANAYLRPAEAGSRPLVPGPLVRARSGSLQELLLEHPGGAKGFFAWHFSLQMGLVALVGSALDLQMPWAPLLAGLMGAGLFNLPVQVRRWRRRRSLARVPLTGRVAEVESGTLVRLSGTIEPHPGTFPALGSGSGAVFARTLFMVPGEGFGGLDMREDIRGVPFYLRLRDGTRVRLDPATVYPLNTPRQVKGVPMETLQALSAARARRFRSTTFKQVVLSPGDRIEVVGCLVRDVRPEGQASPGRGVPMVFALTPGRDQRVAVRKYPRF